MLKARLSRIAAEPANEVAAEKKPRLDGELPSGLCISEFFKTPLWKQFYDLECKLNEQLRDLKHPHPYVYNPLEYAAEVHCAYLRKYLNGKKRLMFVGMNPGPNGMAQNAVPFGNISTVRDLMELTGNIQQPAQMHPKRLIKGWKVSIDEPSGQRIWRLFVRLAGNNNTLETFQRQCFVHNFCPLAYFDAAGKNITPSELKGAYKAEIRDKCLQTLDDLIALVEPEIVVAVGRYVFDCLQHSRHRGRIQFLKMEHPSPRSLHNENWPEKAEIWLKENNLLKYIQAEVAISTQEQQLIL